MPTLRLMTSELLFDFRHGTETSAVMERDQLGELKSASNAGHATYHAVNPMIFDRAIKVVSKLAPDCTQKGTFIDFGCGKGRALLLASKYEFPTVVGIEFSTVLHDICETNLATFENKQGLLNLFELHLGDAAKYRIPDDSTVWFWFNPFDSVTTRCVAKNMTASLERNPRDAYLIYARPTHAQVLYDSNFSVVGEVRIAGKYLDALILSHSTFSAKLS